MGKDDERGLRRVAAPAWTGPTVLVPTLLALILVMLAAGLVWDRLVQRHRQDLTEYLAFEGAEVGLRIEERFRAYRQVLRGARGLLVASDHVSRGEWNAYMRELALGEHHPGILGVGFARWIPPKLLDAHVAAVRAQGFPEYRVWPTEPREAYSAIELLEPFDWRNQRAFGYDMYSEPVRREAMERAVRTGDGALSGKVVLVQETQQDRQNGVLLYLPVFAPGAPTASEAERRDALTGWVYSPFRMNDMVAGMLGQHSGNVRMQIFDGDAGAGSLLYDSHPERPHDAFSGPVQVRVLDLDGRRWTLHLEALPSLAARFEDEQLELVAIGLIGLLLVGMTWSFSMARLRARALARTSDELRRSETRYAALLNLAHEGIAATDEHFRLDFVNPRLAEMLGASPDALRGRALDGFWEGAAHESRDQILSRLRCGLGSRYEAEIAGRDGHRISALVSDAPLTDERGRFKGAIVMIADISERKAVERHIEHLATHDALTGVPNRLRFGELLEQTLERARRYQHRFALLFVDLDRFKEVNDRHGHLAGDRLLVEAARRMLECLRTTDTLGRRGGDEFVVLLPEIEADEDAHVVAEKIRTALARPFGIDGLSLSISSSIGVVLFPKHGEDDHALLRRADEAMYRAKSEGRNCVRAYSD